jgi:hypothetical protein
MEIDWIGILIAVGIFLVVDFLLAWLILYSIHNLSPWQFFKLLFKGYGKM